VSATTVRAGANGNLADAGAKAIACVRIATGMIFFLFAEYKIVGSEFTPVGLSIGFAAGWSKGKWWDFTNLFW
jgi:hypothetical protein